MRTPLSRRSAVKLGGAFTAAPAFLQAQARGPNILFLISDDHSYGDLGCYGNRVVQTPNLDRLAQAGMRFDNCVVSSPQCSPNRSSIFTGCTPHTTGTSRLHTPMPPWETTILEALKEHGYHVGAFRKVHQGNEFNKRFHFYENRGAPWQAFFDSVPAGRPFWLQVGFTDPHRPYKPGAFTPAHDPSKVTVRPFLPDSPAVREDLAHYHDAIARMDGECGEILALLDKRGLADNTLVVFTGDNGMPFPRAKGSCYDPGIRVPLLARWPGRIRAGEVRRELIAHVDLPATWLSAAGLNVPAKMQGRSFLPLLTGAAGYQPRTEVFSERNWHDNFDPIRSVRTERYKLIFNAAPHFPYRPPADLANSPTWRAIVELGRAGKLTPPQLRMLDPNRPVVEFYDLETDPDEFTNLATSTAHRAPMEDCLQRLSRWMHATYDYLPPARSAPGEPSPGRGWPVSL